MKRSSVIILLAAALGAGLGLGAQAQTLPIQVLGAIHPGDPCYPETGLCLAPDGSLYGLTDAGGVYSQGTAFRVTTNGWMNLMASFDITNGSVFSAPLTLGADGNFYGTSYFGGASTYGTVFQLTTNGILTSLVSFAITNGSRPEGGLALGADGALYGTTLEGGNNNNGTVFRLTTNGVLTTLVEFDYTNGANPTAGLLPGPGGFLYGTTSSGGPNGFGTVFELTTEGELTTLASFGSTNGETPSTLALGADGNFYGTTEYGENSTYGGTVFRVTGNGSINTLATFGITNGAQPEAGLTLGPDGNFYGTTEGGGGGDAGTVFRVTTNGVLTTMVTFATTNGLWPEGGLTLGPDGALYGTTEEGEPAAFGNGTVFRMTTNGVLTTLTDFISGEGPQAALAQGEDGNFYGICPLAGDSFDGTAFRITPDGVLTTLVEFNGANGSYGGAVPYDDSQCGLLAMGTDGNFYGTTPGGATNNCGTVFHLTPNGVLTTLAFFAQTNGETPVAGLTLGSNGLFYGATQSGGNSGHGTLFTVTTNGNLTLLTSLGAFAAPTYAENPATGLTPGPGGNFYGTTTSGGITPLGGYGAVFSLATNGSLNILNAFASTNGASPDENLALGSDGNFYGWTLSGGPSNNGVLFQLTPGGELTTIWAPTNDVGGVSVLTLGPDGNLYGTTQFGGSDGYGSVFLLTTNGSMTTLASFNTTNGSEPEGGLTLGKDGNFYGTTYFGGINDGGVFYRIGLPPGISKQPQSQTNLYGSNPEFTVTAYGGTPLAYQWMFGGVGLPGATNASLILANVASTNVGNYSVLITNVYGSITSSVAAFAVLVDLVPPTLAITNVTSGMLVSNAAFTVKGVAADNVGVASVHYSLNAGTWGTAATANGWSNWTAQTTLIPGTNLIAAYAVDLAGNVSTTNPATLFYVLTNQLQIRTFGLGTVAPNDSNAWLQIGRYYSITSAPLPGFVFSNWTIATNWIGGLVKTGTNLQFMMESNLTLQAAFRETNAPTLTITAPTNLQKMTNALATIMGTSSDTWGVAEVWCQVDHGVWSAAATTNGWTNWTTTLELNSGTNSISAQSVNLGGNYSPTGSVSVISSNTFKLQLVFTNTAPLKTNGLVFGLELSSGLDGHIQVSTNLTGWATLTNFVGSNSTLTFRDPAATNSSRRYYRAVIP